MQRTHFLILPYWVEHHMKANDIPLSYFDELDFDSCSESLVDTLGTNLAEDITIFNSPRAPRNKSNDVIETLLLSFNLPFFYDSEKNISDYYQYFTMEEEGSNKPFRITNLKNVNVLSIGVSFGEYLYGSVQKRNEVIREVFDTFLARGDTDFFAQDVFSGYLKTKLIRAA